MRLRLHKTVREIVDFARSTYGCTVDVTNGCHVVLMHPSGKKLYMGLSPSDRRAKANMIAMLKRKLRSK